MPPTLTLTRIYCVMSEENGPEGKCSANLSPPANEGLSHRIDCEVGEAGKGFDNYIRKDPNGDNLVCWFGLNDSREKTRIFQVFGDTVGPKVGVEPSPVPDCVSQKPNGKVLIESEKIALQPKGTVGSMNQSCFRLKPGQKLRAAYCVMKDKDAEGKCVYKQDCDIGDARVGQSSGPIVENGVSYQCVEAVNLSDKVREFQVFGE